MQAVVGAVCGYVVADALSSKGLCTPVCAAVLEKKPFSPYRREEAALRTVVTVCGEERRVRREGVCASSSTHARDFVVSQRNQFSNT